MIEHLKASSPADVAKFYDAKYRATGLDSFSGGDRDTPLRFMMELKPNGKTVLDAGCGSGEFLAHLASRGFECCGIDVSEEAVELLYNRFKDNRLVSVFAMDMATANTFFTPHFDFVTCLGAMEHTMDPFETKRNLMACLNPGGVLIATLPLEFENCLAGIQGEPNQITNERFASVDEWLGFLGSDHEAFKVIGEGPRKDIMIAYRKESQ